MLHVYTWSFKLTFSMTLQISRVVAVSRTRNLASASTTCTGVGRQTLTMTGGVVRSHPIAMSTWQLHSSTRKHTCSIAMLESVAVIKYTYIYCLSVRYTWAYHALKAALLLNEQYSTVTVLYFHMSLATPSAQSI